MNLADVVRSLDYQGFARDEVNQIINECVREGLVALAMPLGLELGLRWLHDRASGARLERFGGILSDVFLGFVKQAAKEQNTRVVVTDIDSLELGLRWLHDRCDPQCLDCQACGYPASGHRFATPDSFEPSKIRGSR